MAPTRREFVKTLAIGTSAAALGGRICFAGTGKQPCTLWQLPRKTRSQMMSYVIRTPGNELIVIDGGTKGDAAYLRKFIQERGNHVHAWFISHPHYDHVDALTAILNNPEDMKIDKIYGSLPDDEWLKKHQDAHALNTQRALLAAAAASNHEVLALSLGQEIKFKGATFKSTRP